MAVYRCTLCGHIDDLPLLKAGEKSVCGKCAHPTTLLDTAMLITSLVGRHGKLLKERDTLKTAIKSHMESAALGLTGPMDSAIPLLANPVGADAPSEFQALIRILYDLKIKARFDKTEQGIGLAELKAAAMLVDQAMSTKAHLEHIVHAYKQGWSTVNLNLQLQDVPQRAILTRLAFELYASGYFVNYASDMTKGSLALGLQPAANFRKFFDGGWLELWLYFQIVRQCQLMQAPYSGARLVAVDIPNVTKPAKLDFAILVEHRELVAVATCTNDHRLEVDRFRALQKQFDKPNCTFIICDPYSDDIRAAELGVHYKLPFYNLDGAVARMHQAVTAAKNPNARLTSQGPPQPTTRSPAGSAFRGNNVVPFSR